MKVRGVLFQCSNSLLCTRILRKDHARCFTHHLSPLDTKNAVLYVHWPYCAKRCTYCNFNKYISQNVNHKRMANCLVKETTTLLQLTGVKQINSIFFGGGTPSLALPSTLANVIETVKSNVTFTERSEVTMEANPSSLMVDKLKEYRAAGVNRLSLGLQAFNDKDLHVLGRDHSVADGLRCLEEAKRLFPGKVSVDMMFGRPGQTLDGWGRELDQLIRICDAHVSLYQLTLERGTSLFKSVLKERKYSLPDNDLMADMYALAVQKLEDSGFKRYEVSNFAKEGACCQHNQAYWTGGQYIGVGPGAHGRFVPQSGEQGMPQREARIQTLEPDNWMWEVERFGHATRKIVRQTKLERLEEILTLGLRTVEGISDKVWSELSEIGSLQSVFGSGDMLTVFKEEGLLELDPRGLRATSQGLMVLDSILPHLLCAMSKAKDVQGTTQMSEA